MNGEYEYGFEITNFVSFINFFFIDALTINSSFTMFRWIAWLVMRPQISFYSLF